MRLIDADKLLTVIPNEEINAKLAIVSAPTIESGTVKRGRWINDKGLYRCSECNELWTEWWANVVPIERMNKMMKYCPTCGAKMSEGREE